jgi:glycosyltransferase involved in cell wall biosynthesis
MLQRVKGKKTVTLLHQVVNDFQELEKSSFKTHFLNFSKNILYSLVKLASSNVIVFEEQLKKYLGNNSNIAVVPHYIPTVKTISKNLARKKLGLSEKQKYVLYFGYLSPYKGIDWLVENWPTQAKNQLIVAGGINPNHSQNVKMKNFVDSVNSAAKKKNILTTGFVKEAELALYFSAVDAVILPYKLFMSSSGPLSFALAYKKPILFSQPLAEYAKTADFKSALHSAQLKLSDFIFDFKAQDLTRVLSTVSTKKKNFDIFSEQMSLSRQKPTIAKQLVKIINQ